MNNFLIFIVLIFYSSWEGWKMNVTGWLPSDLKERGVRLILELYFGLTYCSLCYLTRLVFLIHTFSYTRAEIKL